MNDFLDGVTWFRQSSVRICRKGVEIHVDPWGVTEASQADYILLTHPHYDNFSEEDIARLRGPDTVVVAPVGMRRQLDDVDHFLRPGDLIQLDRIDILGVPAHNEKRKFHPPDAGWLGYVFTVGNVTYYHAGHTDFLESMHGIRCDVAFLPLCADYTMKPEDAVKAGEACGASVIIPIHFGHVSEPQADTRRMAEFFSGDVVLLDRKV